MIRKTALLVGFAAALAFSSGVQAGDAEDQTDPDGVYPPGGDRSLDVQAFDSFCLDDAPYVVYEIVPKGFTPEGPNPATLTITDLDGKPIMTLPNMPLAGKFLFPGAELDSTGTPIDWPGWKEVGGEWVEDSTDAHWRKGINIRVDVNPTAFVDPPVGYPDGSPVCLGPQQSSPPSQTPPDDSATPAGTLPETGSNGINGLLQVGAAFLIGGALLVIGAHRRRTATVA